MVRHVVMFRFKDGVTAAQIEQCAAEVAQLPGLIPEIVEYRFGRDVGVNDGNFDMAVSGDFASVADYVTYRDHPDHRRVVVDVLTPLVAQRAAVQFEW